MILLIQRIKPKINYLFVLLCVNLIAGTANAVDCSDERLTKNYIICENKDLVLLEGKINVLYELIDRAELGVNKEILGKIKASQIELTKKREVFCKKKSDLKMCEKMYIEQMLEISEISEHSFDFESNDDYNSDGMPDINVSWSEGKSGSFYIYLYDKKTKTFKKTNIIRAPSLEWDAPYFTSHISNSAMAYEGFTDCIYRWNGNSFDQLKVEVTANREVPACFDTEDYSACTFNIKIIEDRSGKTKVLLSKTKQKYNEWSKLEKDRAKIEKDWKSKKL